MKKLAKTFLKVGAIIALIAIIVFAVVFVIEIIAMIVNFIRAAANDSDAYVDLALGNLGDAILMLVLEAVAIFNVIVIPNCARTLNKAKTKAEAKKAAIMAIVAGALLTEFPVAAGILMLVMKDEHYAAQEAVVAEQPAEEQPAEEQPAEQKEAE